MYIDILILSQLLKKPHHGYEIKKNIEEIVGRDICVNNNMLYPSLKRFEDSKMVSKKLETQEGKPNRYIYKITGLGKKSLLELIKKFPAPLATHKYEFFTRVMLFNMIDTEHRKHILETRKIVQKKHLDYLNKIKEIFVKEKRTYPNLVMDFLSQQVKNEINWIAKLEKMEE